MCGIAGIYSLDGSKIKNLEPRVKMMIDLIKYRGPDNVGYYFNDKHSFGMSNNQLSIVSPDKKIKLPLTYNNRTFLSFNGEIYNYKFLKEKFKLSEKNFRYKTDTEVLYHILNLNKKDLSDLNGVWSFAYYDNEKHSLQLSRDVLGERNLYFYKNKNELIFCSEIRPIFLASNLNFKIDNEGLQDMWKFYACRDDKTILNACKKLKPGTTKIFSINKIKEINHSFIEVEKWLDYSKKNGEKQIREKFLEIFSQELDLRYPQKVKSYSLLSGGIDSSFQNLYLGNNHRLNTLYGISSDFNSFKRSSISEIDLSKMVSTLIKSKHNFVDLRENIVKETLSLYKNSLECLDPAMLNYSQLSNFIKKKRSKVVIASDGPDELMCGYQKDVNRFIEDKGNFLKTPYHKIINTKTFYKKIFKNIENESKYFSSLDNRYDFLKKNLDISQIKALTYATKSIPEYSSIKADKSFMTHSIEVRQPFLSKKVVEFLCGLPKNYRIDRKRKLGKIFLRNLIKNKIKILSEYPKVGFGINLINDGKVYNKMKKRMNETIDDKKILSELGFKAESRALFLSDNIHRSQKYMIFSLIRSVKNLR